MIWLRWLSLSLLDWLLLLTVPLAAPVIAAFTRAQPQNLLSYSWGWIYGTYDNPPQGDEGFASVRAPFPWVTDSWRGYLNRCVWMIRNPLYGFAKIAGVRFSQGTAISYIGDPDISDKARRPGYYFAKAMRGGKLVAFEFYCVLPWGLGRCLRARLGWKIMTDKFQRNGFAQLVNTCNPFDGYGKS